MCGPLVAGAGLAAVPFCYLLKRLSQTTMTHERQIFFLGRPESLAWAAGAAR